MIARDLGRFPHEVGRMPFADAMDLSADYRSRPPVHVLVAGYLGIKPEAAEDGGAPPAEWTPGPVKGK